MLRAIFMLSLMFAASCATAPPPDETTYFVVRHLNTPEESATPISRPKEGARRHGLQTGPMEGSRSSSSFGLQAHAADGGGACDGGSALL